MTFNDTEEYNLISIAILGCNICSQIKVAHVTPLKAVLGTVKIFAVRSSLQIETSLSSPHTLVHPIGYQRLILSGIPFLFLPTKLLLVPRAVGPFTCDQKNSLQVLWIVKQTWINLDNIIPVYFHLSTMELHIVNALMLTKPNHGALLKLMRIKTTLEIGIFARIIVLKVEVDVQNLELRQKSLGEKVRRS